MIDYNIKNLTDSLLFWYNQNKRKLPWRDSPTPYHIWISEIMLQQTRVEAVKGYYFRFLEALPDIESLANASEDIYMKLWEGLGYYSRVRNLHKGAKQIVEEYQGKMPNTYQELLKIAGIGPYTAAAIASIVFGERTPAIDGNLLRIFSRLNMYEEDIKTNIARKKAYNYFLEYMPEQGTDIDKRAGDFNQALMDLGSMICIPNGKPLCENCPLSEFCKGYQSKREQDFPIVRAKKERKIEKLTILLIHDQGKIALRKRSSKGLLAGLYEFPNIEGHIEEIEVLKFIKERGFSPLRIQRVSPSKHIFTHKEWHMIGYDVLCDELEPNILCESNCLYGNNTIQNPNIISDIFLAKLNEIQEKYSIPSAFRVYKESLCR